MSATPTTPNRPSGPSSGPDVVALAREGWAALRRHRVRAVQVFAGVVVLSVIGALLLPSRYASEAKLMVKIGRESVTLDPTATVGQTVSVYDSRETEVNTILEIMGSRAVLEDAVVAVGPDLVLRAEGDPEDPARIEAAVRELEEATSVERGKKSNIVSVWTTSYSPEVAQRIARAMLDAFRERYLKANRTEGSHEFFVEQEQLIADRLTAAMRELNEARGEFAVGSIEEERARLAGLRATVEADQLSNAAALAAANARITGLERSIGTLPERRVSQEVTGFAEDAAGRTRQQLYQLKLQEHDLLTWLQPTHPDVEAVRERIERAERTLHADSSRTTQTTTAADPGRQQLELLLLTERSNAESYAGRARELDAQRAEVVARERRLDEAEVRTARLVQNVDRLRADHADYAAKLEQARIDQALATERISNVNVWQAPTFVPKPVASKRRLVVFLGVFVGLLSAVGTVVVLEFLRRRREPTTTHPAERPRDGRLRGELATAMSR